MSKYLLVPLFINVFQMADYKAFYGIINTRIDKSEVLTIIL